jgi:hypothetical protein
MKLQQVALGTRVPSEQTTSVLAGAATARVAKATKATREVKAIVTTVKLVCLNSLKELGQRREPDVPGV